MEKEKKEIKAGTIVWWSVFGVLAALTVLGFVFNVTSLTPEILNMYYKPEYAAGMPEFVKYLWNPGLANILFSVQVVVIGIALWYVVKLITKISIHSKKAITIARLLINFLRWIIALAVVFAILIRWGANGAIVAAGAGVVTLVIGLGSQALVADILAGIFIVFEGDFQVGDIIIIDGWRGEVQSIGIRTTKLVDAGGNIKIVTNSDIKSIVNQSKELSVAKCYVGISYNDRIENVEKIIADNIEALKTKIPAIKEGPFYKGVAELGDSAVTLLFVAKCKEDDIYQVQRDMNREIKILFDDNNVNIPFPQLTISYEKDQQQTVTKKVKNEAKEFVEEQKELSKDVDVKK